jgi:hypothetical protein
MWEKLEMSQFPKYFGSCFCRCEVWSLTTREENRLRFYENRALKILHNKDEVRGGNCILRSFTICTVL